MCWTSSSNRIEFESNTNIRPKPNKLVTPLAEEVIEQDPSNGEEVEEFMGIGIDRGKQKYSILPSLFRYKA